MKGKVFISGKVTGLPANLARLYFDQAEKCLTNLGYECVNPMKIVPQNATPAEAMTILLPILTEQCSAIYFLANHIYSEGSKAEEVVARYFHKKILFEEEN